MNGEIISGFTDRILSEVKGKIGTHTWKRSHRETTELYYEHMLPHRFLLKCPHGIVRAKKYEVEAVIFGVHRGIS